MCCNDNNVRAYSYMDMHLGIDSLEFTNNKMISHVRITTVNKTELKTHHTIAIVFTKFELLTNTLNMKILPITIISILIATSLIGF